MGNGRKVVGSIPIFASLSVTLIAFSMGPGPSARFVTDPHILCPGPTDTQPDRNGFLGPTFPTISHVQYNSCFVQTSVQSSGPLEYDIDILIYHVMKTGNAQ